MVESPSCDIALPLGGHFTTVASQLPPGDGMQGRPVNAIGIKAIAYFIGW